MYLPMKQAVPASFCMNAVKLIEYAMCNVSKISGDVAFTSRST
jgi:hypothetical protein